MQTPIAIIGPTASGKTALALDLAKHQNGVILSLDSLSVYKEIDIASAKPSVKQMANIEHFGIDEIYANEDFKITMFFEIYKRAREYAKSHKKRLFIVGGTSFYLKMLIDGISKNPVITHKHKKEVQEMLDTSEYKKILPNIAPKIHPNDTYRAQKALEIFVATNMSVDEWFSQNPPEKIIDDVKIYAISVPRDNLARAIRQRTYKMFDDGLLDETRYLQQKYYGARSLKSIGLKECCEYLHGKISLVECKEQIITHTVQLAKRQNTFNKGQFEATEKTYDEIMKELL